MTAATGAWIPAATRGRPRRGLTLIEVAVSLAIFGGMILALLHARYGLIQQDVATRNRLTAVALVRSKVEEVKAGLAGPGVGRYKEIPEFVWGVRRMDVDVPEESEAEDARVGMVRYLIAVTYPVPGGSFNAVAAILLLPKD